MNKLLKNILTIYVVVKVAPKVIRGVVYITDGALTGIANKVVTDVFVGMDKNRKDRVEVLKDRSYIPNKNYSKD